MATPLDLQVAVLALFPLEVKLAVIPQDAPKLSQESQESEGFSTIWVNFHGLQAATPGGEPLPPEQRVEEAVRAIAKALHAGETVVILCKQGIDRTGALAILVTHRELLL